MNFEKLDNYIRNGSFDDAFEIINQHKESEFSGNICKYIIKQFSIIDHNLPGKRFETLKKLMTIIVTKYDTMDILFQFIEEFQQFGKFSQVKFANLLEYFGSAMLRFPQKRYNSIVWGLNAVNQYVKDLNLSHHLSNEDDNDVYQVVEQTKFITSTLSKFYGVFIKGLNHDSETKSVLVKFVIQLLDKPIAFLNFQDPLVCAIVSNVIEQLILLKPDPFVLLDRKNRKSSQEYQETTELSLGNLFYLILCENLCAHRLPQVYDSVFIFRNCLRFVTLFLNNDNEIKMLKNGLRFARCLLERVKGRSLSHHILDDGVIQNFCMAIIKVTLFDDNKEHRTVTLTIFRQFLLSFTNRGRYLLIFNLMSAVTFPEIRSYLITVYKNMLLEELKRAETSSGELSVYCRGSYLKQTIDLFCAVKRFKAPEDILEDSDPIIANVNFLTFLILKDKNNMTQIWDNLEVIKRYLGKIREDSKELKSEMELKRRDLNTKNDEKLDLNLSVSNWKVKDAEMMQMSPEEQEKGYIQALVTIDVIVSLSIRLEELIDAGF